MVGRAAALMLLLVGLAAAQDVELNCPDSTDTGLLGGFTAVRALNNPRVATALSAGWDAVKAKAAEVPIPIDSACDVNAATITPTAACRQVVAGTIWIVHAEVSFPNCADKLTLKANVPIDLSGVPSVAGAEVTLIEPAVAPVDPVAPTVITAWNACGGRGDDCAAKGACVNAPWPNTICEEGYECIPENVWYWQCQPGVSLTCPPVLAGAAGAFTPSANVTELQPVAAAAWADLLATNETALPANTTCDVAAANVTAISGCTQVVAGTNTIVDARVSFPNCELFTTVSARVFTALDGAVTIEGARVAPFESADEYQQCGADGKCQKVLVFPAWAQSGGPGDACTNAAARLGVEATADFCKAAYPFTQCAFGTASVEVNPSYFQCQPVA